MSEKSRHSVSEEWHEAAAADGCVPSTSGTSGVSGASGMASHGRGHASEIPASGRDNVSGDAETPRPKRPSWVERNVAQVLSGNILTRAEVRRICSLEDIDVIITDDRISEQIKELRSRSLTLSSIRMTATRQSEIIKELEARGIPLQESLTPPKIIDK